MAVPDQCCDRPANLKNIISLNVNNILDISDTHINTYVYCTWNSPPNYWFVVGLFLRALVQSMQATGGNGLVHVCMDQNESQRHTIYDNFQVTCSCICLSYEITSTLISHWHRDTWKRNVFPAGWRRCHVYVMVQSSEKYAYPLGAVVKNVFQRQIHFIFRKNYQMEYI